MADAYKFQCDNPVSQDVLSFMISFIFEKTLFQTFSTYPFLSNCTVSVEDTQQWKLIFATTVFLKLTGFIFKEIGNLFYECGFEQMGLELIQTFIQEKRQDDLFATQFIELATKRVQSCKKAQHKLRNSEFSQPKTTNVGTKREYYKPKDGLKKDGKPDLRTIIGRSIQDQSNCEAFYNQTAYFSFSLEDFLNLINNSHETTDVFAKTLVSVFGFGSGLVLDDMQLAFLQTDPTIQNMFSVAQEVSMLLYHVYEMWSAPENVVIDFDESL